MFTKKSIFCLFALLLQLLINPTAASASETGEVVPLTFNVIGNAAPLTLPSEMGPIAAGAYHTCALTTTGGVICWGAALLGNNSAFGSLVPVNVSGLSSGVRAVVAGGGHTCALTISGGVKCWGSNSYGQLGNNSTTNSPIPVDVNGVSGGVSAIAAGAYHTCALTTNGGVKCWGWNLNGQLGNNSTTNSPIPVDVSGLSSGATAIAVGLAHSCALTTTGGVKCWGFNTSGQLGAEPITSILTPVAVIGLSSGVSAIAAGGGHTCALTVVGGVMCWGSNDTGSLGNNSPTTYIPVNVSGLSSEVSAIATGYASHTCALTTTGGAKCWGNNDNGQLGNNSTEYHIHIPVDVSGLSSGVTAITAGLKHTCALISSGGIKCWGDNSGGQLGNNSYIGSPIPVDVAGIAPPSAIFTDVPVDYWANSYIERLYNAGVTSGCGSGVYCPDSTVTRAQMAVFLLKGIHGSSYSPPVIGVGTGFSDVPGGYWAAAWIKQLAAEGITGGCGAGTYCPDATVTRAQMAVFLLKGKHGTSYAPPAATGVFTDVPVGYWARNWIEQLALEGITGGCGTGVYCPDAGVTRAQMAVFLVKTFNLP